MRFSWPAGSALHGNAANIAATLAAPKTLQNRMSFARHSSLTDLTQRSAYEFKFGLRMTTRTQWVRNMADSHLNSSMLQRRSLMWPRKVSQEGPPESCPGM